MQKCTSTRVQQYSERVDQPNVREFCYEFKLNTVLELILILRFDWRIGRQTCAESIWPSNVACRADYAIQQTSFWQREHRKESERIIREKWSRINTILRSFPFKLRKAESQAHPRASVPHASWSELIRSRLSERFINRTIWIGMHTRSLPHRAQSHFRPACILYWPSSRHVT